MTHEPNDSSKSFTSGRFHRKNSRKEVKLALLQTQEKNERRTMSLNRTEEFPTLNTWLSARLT